MLPADPFLRVPGIADPGDAAAAREDRVADFAAVMRALIDGTTPPRAAALRVGAGGMGWLEAGGYLDAHLGLRTSSGRRDTPQAIWAALRREL